jgi:hypothetical protein
MNSTPNENQKIFSSLYRECRRQGLVSLEKQAELLRFIRSKDPDSQLILIEHGRHTYYEAFKISIFNNTLLFPIPRAQDINKDRENYFYQQEVFLSLGWIFPPYFGIGQMDKLAAYSDESCRVIRRKPASKSKSDSPALNDNRWQVSIRHQDFFSSV